MSKKLLLLLRLTINKHSKIKKKSVSKTDTLIRCQSCLTRCAPATTCCALQPLQNSWHVELDAVVRDDGVAVVEEHGKAALHPSFINVTASRERVCSAQKTLKQQCSRSARTAVSYTMVLMKVILCRRREKPVILMSTGSSSLWRSARTRRLYERCAGPRGKQAWRGPGSSEGAGGPSTPFSSRLLCSNPNARGASTPTNPRASDQTSSDNETQAVPKCQSQDVADSSS